MTNNTPDYEDNLYFEKKMTDCKNCPYTDEYCASGDCERDNNLTEQWRNGTLPQDYYYVQYNSNVKEGKPWVEIELRTYLFDLAKVRDAKYCKILAPVPSYEEYEQLENWSRFTADYHALREAKEITEYEKVELLEKEKHLKELLKECKGLFVLEKGFMVKCIREETLSDIITKIDEAIK